MPLRHDISKVLIIGAGPIVIGQACEFDYSGAQACKALREEGIDVVLVNSNPATIMTDPAFAFRTYIEPLSVESLTAIIRRERPDALLPTMGGQTALNLAVALDEAGVLRRFDVELIGATADVIRRAEDRGRFREAMASIGLAVPKSGEAHSLDEVLAVARAIGSYPLIVRPGFTLGGAGGGIAHDETELRSIASNGLALSPASEVLVEESVLGWKEFEMEVMRDGAGNACIVCSIENLDPMGVHTGDSITVAPAMTLTDPELQRLRDASLAVMEAVGVETGGANVQFAVNPANGEMVVIEMNPRVSRSSALASKATGFPIAKIAAKVAVGLTLPEIANDITRVTPSCFEPSLDYVVVKVPRFAFEKFEGSDDTLSTTMRAVGETMALGGNFEEAFQKALRGLEVGRAGFAAPPRGGAETALSDDALAAAVARPTPARVFALHEAFARGWSVERVAALSAIDPWFLRKMAALADEERAIAAAGSLAAFLARDGALAAAKAHGFSDAQLASLLGAAEDDVRAARLAAGLEPDFALVDTCAAEFDAATPYYFSTYGEKLSRPAALSGDRHAESVKKKILILGGGPNRIGQGIEFDYCCVHASLALREAGYETVMLNSNPETVSTDYDASDRLYFEPVTLENVLSVYHRENCSGVVVQFGGQTPLNIASRLEAAGAHVIGTSPKSIEEAEDRKFFSALARECGIRQPENGTATTLEEARGIAERIGWPVLVRPSFVLGGRAMVIVWNRESFDRYCEEAFAVSAGRPVLIDKFLEDAIEVDVDCIADGERQVIGAVMEHIEKAGIHSGDSACFIPPQRLAPETVEEIERATRLLAQKLAVKGLMNVQYAVQDGTVYILEVNPRASRTVPFVGKATGVPLAALAAKVMAGETLSSLGVAGERSIPYVACKEAVLPFARFPGSRVELTPEMHATGEVMGLDRDAGLAFLKSQIAAGNPIPAGGGVFVSVAGERRRDRAEMVELAKELVAMGYRLFATCGSATTLRDAGVEAHAAFSISEGRPNVLDLVADGSVGWIVNVPSGLAPLADETRMREEALRRGVPLTTTMRGLAAAIAGLKRLRERCGDWEVLSLQEYHRHAAKKGTVK
jgi:carbamoyl-phosphate synthase large subunit